MDKLAVAQEYLSSGGDGERPLRRTTIREANPVIIYQNKDGGDLRQKKNLL